MRANKVYTNLFISLPFFVWIKIYNDQASLKSFYNWQNLKVFAKICECTSIIFLYFRLYIYIDNFPEAHHRRLHVLKVIMQHGIQARDQTDHWHHDRALSTCHPFACIYAYLLTRHSFLLPSKYNPKILNNTKHCLVSKVKQANWSKQSIFTFNLVSITSSKHDLTRSCISQNLKNLI